jgi:hypothetical protein
MWSGPYDQKRMQDPGGRLQLKKPWKVDMPCRFVLEVMQPPYRANLTVTCCTAVPKVEEISTISEQTGTGVWLSSDASRTIFITTASMNSRCGAAFGTRTVCPDGGHCTRNAGGYSTCSQCERSFAG